MAITLTPGTNTYQDLATADAYLDVQIHTTNWAFQDPDTKSRALITAFNVLEAQSWQGTKTGTPQHPRSGLTNCNGDEIPDSDVAPDIIAAQAELAFLYTEDIDLANSTGDPSNIKKAVAGSAEVEYFNPANQQFSSNSNRFPPRVHELVKCYLSGRGSFGSPTAFGTDACSTAGDQHDLNSPLA